MQRRRFVCSCAAGLLLSRPTISHAQWTKKAVGANEAPPPKAEASSEPRPHTQVETSSKTTTKGLRGCYLNSADGATKTKFRLSRTTGLAALDAGLTSEFNVLCQYFEATPGFFIFDDGPSGNAFATPETLGSHSLPHGTVCLGNTLMLSEFQAASGMGRGDHVLVAVMAHEWAHIVQFQTLPQMVPGKRVELQADYMAGWYMGIRAAQVWGGVDLMSSVRSLFSKGDYNFNSPGHHGKPEERALAFQRGVLAARTGMNNIQAFKQSAQEVGL
jgi:hypothetical protein